MREVGGGLRSVANLAVDDMLDYLETAPVFYRSGYLAEMLLRELRRRTLDPGQVRRLQNLLVDVARSRDCREYRRYCRVAVAVDNEGFRARLRDLADTEDPDIRRRATWMLAALGERAQGRQG